MTTKPKHQCFTLHVEPTGCVLSCGDENITVAHNAEDILNRLSELKYHGQPLIITLPSDACYAATIDLSILPSKPNASQLLYAMEEHFPFAAEDFSAAVILPENEKNQHAFGVATEHKSLLLLIEQLEAQNVRIEHISPRSLLALEHLLHKHEELSDCYVIYQEGETADLFYLDGQKPQAMLGAWFYQSANASRLKQKLSVLLTQKNAKVYAVNCDASLVEAIGIDVVAIKHENIAEASYAYAAECLKNKTSPRFDLRQGDLASKDQLRRVKPQVLTLALVACLALTFIVGGIFYRASEYDQIALNHKKEIQDLHLETTGHHSQTPISDLRIKAQTLSALHPARQNADVIAANKNKPSTRINRSSIDMLNQTLSRLPPNIRINLSSISAQPDQVTLRGFTQSLVNAENIERSLKKDKILNTKNGDAKLVNSLNDKTQRRASFIIVVEPKAKAKGGH